MRRRWRRSSKMWDYGWNPGDNSWTCMLWITSRSRPAINVRFEKAPDAKVALRLLRSCIQGYPALATIYCSILPSGSVAIEMLSATNERSHLGKEIRNAQLHWSHRSRYHQHAIYHIRPFWANRLGSAERARPDFSAARMGGARCCRDLESDTRGDRGSLEALRPQGR